MFNVSFSGFLLHISVSSLNASATASTNIETLSAILTTLPICFGELPFAATKDTNSSPAAKHNRGSVPSVTKSTEEVDIA